MTGFIVMWQKGRD